MSLAQEKSFEYTPLESQIDIIFDAYCDCCNAEFTKISHEDNKDFLAWLKREADSARRSGWTETEDKVFCPNCDESDFLAKIERKKVSEAKKAKEGILAATQKSWTQRLVKLFQK